MDTFFILPFFVFVKNVIRCYSNLIPDNTKVRDFFDEKRTDYSKNYNPMKRF